ncbi:hypothetical protein STRDD11_01998 [Streptococcus sp. DD11]|nr:hypothetical protein STRDD11_01998 [Streptococcus sp. DD11]
MRHIFTSLIYNDSNLCDYELIITFLNKKFKSFDSESIFMRKVAKFQNISAKNANK